MSADEKYNPGLRRGDNHVLVARWTCGAFVRTELRGFNRQLQETVERHGPPDEVLFIPAKDQENRSE